MYKRRIAKYSQRETSDLVSIVQLVFNSGINKHEDSPVAGDIPAMFEEDMVQQVNPQGGPLSTVSVYYWTFEIDAVDLAIGHYIVDSTGKRWLVKNIHRQRFAGGGMVAMVEAQDD